MIYVCKAKQKKSVCLNYVKFDMLNRYLKDDGSHRWNWNNIKLDMNCICLGNINSHIFDISCISHKLPITCYRIFEYTNINQNPIKIIREVLVDSNVGKKIQVISIANSIRLNFLNVEKKVIEWSIGKGGSHFLGFFYKA